MTYQERIQQIGQGKKPTKLVQKAVDEYEEVLLAIEKGKSELEETDDDEEKESIVNDLNELEETADLMLLKLEKTLKNWENGIKRVENMNQKKGIKSNEPTPNVSHTTLSTIGNITATNTTTSRTGGVGSTNQPTPDTKKDSSWGWLLFGGLALVLSLGAINVMNKK